MDMFVSCGTIMFFQWISCICDALKMILKACVGWDQTLAFSKILFQMWTCCGPLLSFVSQSSSSSAGWSGLHAGYWKQSLSPVCDLSVKLVNPPVCRIFLWWYLLNHSDGLSLCLKKLETAPLKIGAVSMCACAVAACIAVQWSVFYFISPEVQLIIVGILHIRALKSFTYSHIISIVNIVFTDINQPIGVSTLLYLICFRS